MQYPEPTAMLPTPPPPPASRWPLAFVAATSLMLAAALVALYKAPEVPARWRLLDEQIAADAVFLKREAELKAESEAAERHLAVLDRQIHLVSLGFREVARKIAPLVVNLTNEKEVPKASGRRRTFYDYDAD